MGCNGVDLEIEARNLARLVVGRLSGAMHYRIENFSSEQLIYTTSVSNINI